MANEEKNISYLNKSFTDFKSVLQQYAKTYFPTTYNDFSEATPGNMFIEMASYIGDVMSFYLDTQIQENFLLYTKEKENLYAISYTMGYRPRASYAAHTTVDIYQLIPTTISGTSTVPDFSTYGLLIPANTTLVSNSTGIKFITINEIDFTNSNDTEITYVDDNFFLLKKSTPAVSAEIKTTTISFSGNEKFAISNIIDNNGSGNVFSNIAQSATATYNPKCNLTSGDSQNLSSVLATAIQSMQKATQQLNNTSQLRQTRRSIARAKTRSEEHTSELQSH